MSIFINNLSITGDCENTGSGSVYFNITGDTPPFGVVCTNPGCTLPSSGGTTFYSANGLSAGTYFLQVTDGASVSTIQAVYISSGTTVAIDSQNTTCGLNDGAVTGFTSGVHGFSSFYLYDGDDNYLTSGTSLGTSYEFQSLSAGTYYVVANDGGGCTGITSTVIINPSIPFTFGGYVVNDGSCIGTSSGKIFITGLTPPNSAYTVNWTSNVNGQTGMTITGLTADAYIATITTPNGCTVSESFTVQSVPPLVSAGFITINQPACFASDGEVEFIIAGGTAPYFFSGSSGQVEITFDTSVTFTGLSSGMYGFLVTDAGLCTIYDSVNLQTPNSFSTVAINSTNSFCSTNSGAINVIIDGGVTSEPSILITVSGSTGTQQIGTLGAPNQTFYNLPNGDYIVMVETIGCSYTAQTSINSVNLYTVTTITSGTTCGSNNGSLQVTPSSGGTLPYQYSLTGPTGNPMTDTNPTGYFSNLSGGNYVLTVQDSGSPACVQTFPIYIDSSENVFFNMFPNQPLNGNDGSITTFITQGEPPFTYNWSSNVNGQTGSTVTGLTADTYSLSVTDASGCTLSKSVMLGGTKVYSDYRYYTICNEPFTNTGLVTKRGIRSMYLEGYSDLSSGDTNCVINSAIFSIYSEVGSQSAQTEFYVSTGSTDYPSDTLWANTIKTTLEDFVGVSGVTVDIQTNRITITTNCEEVKTGCIVAPVNPLQDTVIKVNLLIDYDISCVSCGDITPTPTPTSTVTPMPTSTPTNTPTPTPTSTAAPTPTTTSTATPTPTPTKTPTTPTPTPTLTSTPTPTPIAVPTCSVIYNTSGVGIYSYDVTTNSSVLLGDLFASADIAHTQDKMWLYNNFTITEYDITLSPWSYSLNRVITLPYQIGPGLGVINNTKLLSSNGVNSSVLIEIDITTTTASISTLFPLTGGRIVSGDILYTTTGKILVTSVLFGSTYLSQYDYLTGALEVDVNITSYTTTPYGLFQSSGLIYIINTTGAIYNVPVNSPYTPVFVQTIPTGGSYLVFGSSQVPSCITTNLIP